MRRTIWIALASLVVAAAAPAEIVPSGRRVLELSPETERIFADVLVHSMTGMRDRELAAFVVEEERDGTLGCILWPGHAGVRSESFSGVVPAGTVAIVHSHPDGTSARPSRGDVAVARRLVLPFIVVTRTEIWIAGARGGAPVNLARGRLWASGESHDCICRNAGAPSPPIRSPHSRLARGEKEP